MTATLHNETPRNISRRFYFMAMASAALFANACSSPVLRPGKSLGIPPMSPRAHRIEGVPFYPAEGKRCGPASLAGVMAFYGLDADVNEIADKVMEAENIGAYHRNIYLYAVSRGMNAQMYSGGIRDLKRMVALDRPVMLLLDLALIGAPRGHWVVVTGYDEERLYINDQLRQNRRVSRRELYAAWKKADYLTILVLPPTTLAPPTSDELALMALAKEKEGDWEEAERLYRRSLERGNVKVGAIIGVGNARLKMGDPPSAVAWYRLALRHDPNRDDARINMANAYLRMGKTRKALRLINTALKDKNSPYRAYALDTLGDIRAAQGRNAEALQAWQEALAHPPPEDPDFQRSARGKIDAHLAE